ncbi:MAG: glutathione S-transferase family protein [Pseudomonadota bacterium]
MTFASKKSIVLLGLKVSVYTRIARLVLEEKRLDYTLEEMDIFQDSGPPAQYLAQNPYGTIPCLVHGDFCLYETVAINKYIDSLDTAIRLQPVNTQHRARMNQVISVLDSYAYRPMIWEVFVERVLVPEEEGEPNEAVVENALPVIELTLKQLEMWMGELPFLAGPDISLADLHAFPMILYLSKTPEGVEMLASHRNIDDWLHRMKGRQSVVSTRSEYD